ncbi:DUF7522 family protein [Halosolutus gelatinilyticus]|uniref:DUF7522 family protein n=1 Tax=Halosolutus gelatinilyticus TaxID=2931975 RepID=UPI001FF6E8FC|nr:hypothetical protein [Halosolutus gelatinilyticus]
MATGLLTTDAVDRFVTTCRDSVGSELRSVTYFTRDDFEQVYLRDDLERNADLETFIGNEWRGFKVTQAAYEGSELGTYQYTIRVFDNGYLLRVTSDREGVFVTTDDLTLEEFESLASVLHDELERRALD